MRTLFSFTLVVICIALSTPLDAARDIVQLRSGDSLRGTLRGTEAGFVVLELPTIEGQVLRRLAFETIERIDFYDAQELDELLTSELPLDERELQALEAMVTRRAPLLGNLQEADERAFPFLLQAYIESDQALQALVYAKIWQDKLSIAAHRYDVSEILIQAALAADLVEEASVHAERWLRSGEGLDVSALPWHALAEAKLAEDLPEEGLWIALQPIAYRQEPAPRHLRLCYLSAAKAAEALNAPEYAARLRNEANGKPAEEVFEDTETTSPSHPPLLLPASLYRPQISFSQVLKSSIPQ